MALAKRRDSLKLKLPVKPERHKNTATRMVPTQSLNYVSSFAGFFPADKPQYAMVIVIDTPKGEYYGGEIAAPVFRDIVYHIMGLPYEDNPIFFHGRCGERGFSHFYP
jgi:hypothetical protein